MADTESDRRAESVPMGDAPISLEQVRVARLEPGDKLVVTCPGILTQQEADMIKGYLERCFPGVESLVLSGGIELEIVRQSDGVALENPGDFEAPGRGRKVSGSAPGTPVKRASETTTPEHSDGSGSASDG